MSEPTAREKFVEAMTAVLAHTDDRYAGAPEFKKMACDAVNAFADAECRAERTKDARGWWAFHCAHEDCRASLRKECGL